MDKYSAITRFFPMSVLDVYGMKKKAGEVGIEIETEGANLPDNLQYHWDVKGDGSLRATKGTPYEYVLRSPVARDKVSEVLRYLNKKFVEWEAKPDYSYRTSVHVHINAQPLTILEVFTWLTVYFVVEDMITSMCGRHRIGNRFCLRASDAEGIIGNIIQSLQTGNLGAMTNPAYRYSACNFSSLAGFGSLEFRALRGTNDEETITRWINLLLHVKDASKEFANPKEVIEKFSARGPRAFLELVTPSWFFQEHLWDSDRDTLLWDGARRAMDIAYCGVNWSAKKQESSVLEPQYVTYVVAEPDRPVRLGDIGIRAEAAVRRDQQRREEDERLWRAAADAAIAPPPAQRQARRNPPPPRPVAPPLDRWAIFDDNL